MCVVGRDVSKQPPWSMEMSTSTALRFMSASWARVITRGAFAPRTRTAPMTRSMSRQELLDRERGGEDRRRPAGELGVELAQAVDAAVGDVDLGADADRDVRRLGAGDAAADDEHLARGDPCDAAEQEPRPPSGRSSMNAPAWVAILPATSLIGASSGSRPAGP